MRTLSVIFLFAVAQLCAADVIRLKNGRVIKADSVRETDTKVEYEIDENTFTIPKSLVEKIEAGVGGPVRASSKSVELLAPAESMPITADLRARVIRDGKVDVDGLNAAAQSQQPGIPAAAYFVAATHEQRNGDPSRARQYFEQALSIEPENPSILEHYAALLLRSQLYKEAVRPAEAATRVAPQSADAHGLYGIALSYSGRPKEAAASLKRSLELRPNPIVDEHLAQVERDALAEADFMEQGSSHFTLKFEGGQVSPTFRRQLLETLETHYDDLQSHLGIAPRESILVILYTEQAFFDVTKAPQWTGALNDGKLRIPVAGLQTVSGELWRVLKHELAHTFVGQITKGRCPQWLNEGIATLLEPSTIANKGSRLAALYGVGGQIPLSQLEGSFMRYSDREAALAYAESLAAVEYIRDTYGMSDVVRILERIGEGQSAEAAMRNTIRSGYAGFESELAGHLKKTYPQ